MRIDLRDPKNRPVDLADRFKPGKYDVYLLGDIDSTAFQGDELANLAKCVGRGAGLMMLGGFQSFGPGGYGQTPLANVLPVGMDRLERQQPDEPLRTDLHWPGPLRMQPTALGLMHFALMLAGNRQENAALWAKLPPLEGANKFHDLAPGAVVLADAGSDKPLLVTHNFGDGRVLAFAGDSTWHWWMQGYESAFKRFWRQVVLWLARKTSRRRATCGFGWAAAFRPVAAGGIHRGRHFAHRRTAWRRGLQGRDRAAERRAAARSAGAAGRPDGRLVPRHANPRRLHHRSLGHAEGPTARQRPGRFLVFQQDLELDNAAADAPRWRAWPP